MGDREIIVRPEVARLAAQGLLEVADGPLEALAAGRPGVAAPHEPIDAREEGVEGTGRRHGLRPGPLGLRPGRVAQEGQDRGTRLR